MAGIFINYRRGDEASFAGRLYDRLERVFPGHQLFMDVDNIAPGTDFVEALDSQVHNCDVLLAVIGPGWLGAKDEHGERRLDHDYDFVRIEIGAALERGKRVIPVLVGSTPMVKEAELPPQLKSLARRQGVRITTERFHRDCDGLIHALKIALEQMAQTRAAAARPADPPVPTRIETPPPPAEPTPPEPVPGTPKVNPDVKTAWLLVGFILFFAVVIAFARSMRT